MRRVTLCLTTCVAWGALVMGCSQGPVSAPVERPSGSGPPASLPGGPRGDGPPHFLAEGRKGMVVGLTGPRGVRAGTQCLKQGGGAVDAALTTAMVQIVEAGGSFVSFAGILSLVYYDASTGRAYALNAGYNTILDEKDPLTIPAFDPAALKGAPSGRTALVPGFMPGALAAHERFGKLSRDRLVEPAVALAEQGFDIDPMLAGYISYRKGILGRLPETRRVFTKADGTFLGAGNRFRQPALAQTLRRVAAEGMPYLTTGRWGRRFVEAVRREGGALSIRDLESYRVRWEEPLETSYRGARVLVPGPSSSGGVDLLEALNLVELAELRRVGLPTESSESLFRLMQVASNPSDSSAPDLAAQMFPGRDFGPGKRITKDHARWLWARMNDGTWPFSARFDGTKNRPGHSSGVVAIDRWGNVAALTHTINTALWGNTGIFVDGVSIPDSAAFQQKEILKAGPGRRLPDPMCPVVVLRDARPVLASTAIGGGLHQRNVQVLTNILEFQMNAQRAVEAPAFLTPDWDGKKLIAQVVRGTYPPMVLEGVRKRGQPIQELPKEAAGMAIGYWAGVEIDPETGVLRGAGTGELPSYAEAY